MKKELTLVLLEGFKNAQQKDIKKARSMAKAYSPGSDVSIQGLKEAITEALFEADYDTFKGCISILLDKCDDTDITTKTGLSKSTLYRICEPTSNPTLENIGKVLSYMNDFDDKTAA